MIKKNNQIVFVQHLPGGEYIDPVKMTNLFEYNEN